MKIGPGLEALLSGRARVSEIREVRLEDLLRREPVRLDPSTIRATLQGRRVLVTGAGGSIGGEICRQVAAAGPVLLVLLDRHEGGLFEIEAELAEAHPGAPRASALVDIKHAHKLAEVFAKGCPPRARLVRLDDLERDRDAHRRRRAAEALLAEPASQEVDEVPVLARGHGPCLFQVQGLFKRVPLWAGGLGAIRGRLGTAAASRAASPPARVTRAGSAGGSRPARVT